MLQPNVERLVAGVSHLANIALRYSAVGSVAVLGAHALRHVLSARIRAADLVLSLLVAAASALPAWRVAYGLTSGGQLLDSENALPLRITFFAALGLVYPLLWLHHLSLCGTPGVVRRPQLPKPLARITPRARTLLALGAAVALLVLLVELFDRRLRAYMFLLRFALPALWLLAATVTFALFVRLPRAARWLVAGVGTLGLGLSLLAPVDAHAHRRVRGELARRVGASALAELFVTRPRQAAYAQLDFHDPTRFRCKPEPPGDPGQPARRSHRNVILISVDALRRDALSFRRNKAPVAPQLRAFGAQSVSFSRAVTTYPATIFALGSALTGLHPSEILFAPRVPPNVFSLTKTRFDRRFIMMPDSGWFRRRIVRRLITQNVSTSHFVDSRQQTDAFIARLHAARARDQTVFGWIHFFDVHAALSRENLSDHEARISYEQAVGYVDAQIGRILHTLDSLAYFRDSLVIVFADHGEALGELGYFGHHVYLNQFIADIPLFVRAPGERPRRVDRLAVISDIAPTILQWLGAPGPATDAESLLAPRAQGAPERYAFAEAFPLRGRALFSLATRPVADIADLRERLQTIRTSALDYQPKISVTSARHRLIVNRETGDSELYDRKRDPRERDDLAGEAPAIEAAMQRALATWVAEQSERIYCRVAAASAPP